MAPLSLRALAERLGAAIEGPDDREVTGVATLSQAGPSDLSFLGHPRYVTQLEESSAAAVLIGKGATVDRPPQCTFLRVDDPYLALAGALEVFHHPREVERAISDRAYIDPDAQVGEGLAALPGSYVGAGSVLGRNVTLHPGAVVGSDCQLGDDVVLHPHVVLYPGCRLGNRVTVHAGTVLGADGFGYAQGAEGLIKIPQAGGLVVEDDVEVGANSALDRGSLGDTRIGRNTKIDNLCQIAHNVQTGAHCVLVSQSGIAGSTTLGNGVVLAGQAGVSGHLVLGDGARVAAKSAALQDVPAGATVAGTPAIDMGLWRRAVSLTKRLPEILGRLRALEKARSSEEE